MFYDVRDHMEVLHKVFRLNEHPGFVIWTNRFPVSYLEGLEDLIQDPHKMLDEVNGRRFQVRRYLDTGEPLDCREQERCQHCFIEPFCSSTDEFIQTQNTSQFEVWKLEELGDSLPEHLPYGAEWIGLDLPLSELTELLANESALERLPARANGEAPGLELWTNDADLSQQQMLMQQQLRAQTWAEFRLVLSSAEQLQGWWALVCEHAIAIEIQLNRSTATWMFEHRDALREALDQGGLQLQIHQPSYEKLDQAVENDVRDPGQFFAQLDLPVRVSGLPLCLLGNPQQRAKQVPPRQRLRARYFDWDTGRVAVRELARRHIVERYFAKSERCRDCSVSAKCDGLHINMIEIRG